MTRFTSRIKGTDDSLTLSACIRCNQCCRCRTRAPGGSRERNCAWKGFRKSSRSEVSWFKGHDLSLSRLHCALFPSSSALPTISFHSLFSPHSLALFFFLINPSFKNQIQISLPENIIQTLSNHSAKFYQKSPKIRKAFQFPVLPNAKTNVVVRL